MLYDLHPMQLLFMIIYLFILFIQGKLYDFQFRMLGTIELCV